MSNLPPPPESLALYIEVLGLDDTLRLLERYGGTKLWIPSGVNNSSVRLREKLEEEFGKPMTRTLIRTFGGDVIKPPLANDWRMAYYASQGLSAADIARKLGRHQDTVWRKLKRARDAERQRSLPI